jgi:hypothetical protein
VLINEKNVVFETSIQVGLQAKFANDGVVVAIDVSIHTIHTLENLPNHIWEGLGERYT